ncbi:MinD/ParA family protein [Megalodesulfovibrio gigas]|uniref:Putative flagellar synthesis regulator FleN n=1 Tax=Megalodesulfovibrio gigas (strain ATCC 19364 / DSM 1382 / NCIMB 9332 / VKM B-1759) TaxID=1121448 RepID=T2GDV8_MEGG1|nr:MinD/ParA family protein [Megalodesulfovibrio gigas]AGW14488.1 putative flagellar synthesis regulator FleN [Megalodesulfovibrio gigas DSM 1382 = ATCC 19364]
MTLPNKTLSIAILSGKGGVGKTNIALNLSYCLFKAGHPLLLMDCDIGLANLDVLLGIAPEKTIQDLVDEDMPLQEIVLPLARGFDLLPAASGVPELLELDDDARDHLFERLRPLFSRYDFAFMDLGAGISPTVLSFAAMSHVRVVVVTPEPTSLTDSYALIKVLATQHGLREFHVVVNMAESPAEEREAFHRLNATCERFLGFSVTYLGGIALDKHVPDAVRKQSPLMKLSPTSDAARDIMAVAVKLAKLREARLPELAQEQALRPLTQPHKNIHKTSPDATGLGIQENE